MKQLKLGLLDLPTEIKARINKLMLHATANPGSAVEIPAEISTSISKITTEGLREEIMAIRKKEHRM